MEGIKQLATAKRRAVLNLPFYSLGEEIWNAVSHGIGAGLSIAALVLLMVFTPKNSYTHLQFIGIQHFYDFALCDFHLISCAACDKRKKGLSNLGPLYHFLYDSRYVYANAAVMRKRNHRLGHVGCGMGRVRHWYLIKRSGHEAL